MTFKLIENERRRIPDPKIWGDDTVYLNENDIMKPERRKPVNIVNEANRLALAGSCTCGDCDDVPMSDFAKAVLICEAATLLDELTAEKLHVFRTLDGVMTELSTSIVEVKQLVEKLHDIAEELAGSRVLELYGPEVE